MRILYINHYAGSPKHGMEYRPYYLSREWLKDQHEVLIVSASFSHVRSRQPISRGKISREIIDDIPYQWYSAPRYAGNNIGRIINIFFFLWRLWKDAETIVTRFKPNVVIASSTYPLDIWVAKKISKKSKAKLIFEVHDLWPLSPIEIGGLSRKNPFIMLCQSAENYAYKNSDVVVSMLPKVHEHMSSHGLNLKKLHIIPNGILEEDWNPTTTEKIKDHNLCAFLKEQKSLGRIIVGYAGSHGRPNGLEHLLDAAEILKNDNFSFVFVGDGLQKKQLLEQKSNLEISNVFFFSSVSKKEIPHLLSFFDICFIGAQHIPIYRFGISPNKLMDYMMAARPIICAIKAGNDPVTDCQCGITVEPGNPDAIAQGIIKLASLSSAERSQMGQRGKEYILKNQTYKVLAKKFLDVMQ